MGRPKGRVPAQGGSGAKDTKLPHDCPAELPSEQWQEGSEREEGEFPRVLKAGMLQK